MSLPPIIVLGSGVSGLTSAVTLGRAGYPVQIVTTAPPLETTSVVAAAVWYPSVEEPRGETEAWSRVSLSRFLDLIDAPGSGVFPTRIREYLARPLVPEWSEWVPGYRELTTDEIPDGYASGFEISVPRIDPPRYLPYLVGRLEELGTTITVRPPINDLAELVGPGRIVVNCAGLGARQLIGDGELFAIRGQVVAVTNPGLVDGRLDETAPIDIGYVLPRIDEVILGGTRQIGDERIDPDAATTARILADTVLLEPRLVDAEVRGVRVGLRPGRSSVRVATERTNEGWVVHNYGHGGSGYTLSWGCAAEVLRLVDEVSRA
jgi:D-amino-acid oxidase